MSQKCHEATNPSGPMRSPRGGLHRNQKARLAAFVSAALRCAHFRSFVGLTEKAGDQRIELRGGHRLAQQKSLTRVATKLRQKLKIGRRRHADSRGTAAEVMGDLNDGLADVGVCRDGAATLDERAVDLDLGKRHLAYGLETERPPPEIVDRYRGAALLKPRQAGLKRLHLVDDLALRYLEDQARPVTVVRAMQQY